MPNTEDGIMQAECSLSSSTLHPGAMAVSDAYAFLYGQKATDSVLGSLQYVLPTGTVTSILDLRRMVMALDRQTHLTSATLRFNGEHLHYVDLLGFTLAIDLADIAVSSSIAAGQLHEPHMTGLFQRYIRPGWRVADIGANVGYFSMLARSLVGPSGEVLSFEPNSENCRLILLSSIRNGFDNVCLFPLALSDHVGHAYFSTAVGSNGGVVLGDRERLEHGMGQVVPTARLDDLVRAPLDFIKMDTEGSEYRILRGCQALLGSCRPIITTEFSIEMLGRVSGANPRDLLSLLLSFGYTLYVIDKNSGRFGPLGDVDSFLSNWGFLGRIEDLVALPLGTQVLQP